MHFRSRYPSIRDTAAVGGSLGIGSREQGVEDFCIGALLLGESDPGFRLNNGTCHVYIYHLGRHLGSTEQLTMGSNISVSTNRPTQTHSSHRMKPQNIIQHHHVIRPIILSYVSNPPSTAPFLSASHIDPKACTHQSSACCGYMKLTLK